MSERVALLGGRGGERGDEIITKIKTETRDKWHVGAGNRPFSYFIPGWLAAAPSPYQICMHASSCLERAVQLVALLIR